jgi:hypothetical protein
MQDTKPLIQQMKEEGDLQPIREPSSRTYYTCVRYNHVKLGEAAGMGALGTPLTYYGPAQWSCMKGWFETHGNTFRGKSIDSKVVDYCSWRGATAATAALKKELAAPFTLFTPKS